MGVDYLGRFTRDFVEEFRLGRYILDASVASSWMNSTWWQNWLQENSATAGIHLRPGTSCETIWDPLKPSKTIWDHLRLSKTIWDHLRQSEAMWDHLRPSKTLWGPLRPFETIWDPLRPSENAHNVWHHLRQGECKHSLDGTKGLFCYRWNLFAKWGHRQLSVHVTIKKQSKCNILW